MIRTTHHKYHWWLCCTCQKYRASRKKDKPKGRGFGAGCNCYVSDYTYIGFGMSPDLLPAINCKRCSKEFHPNYKGERLCSKCSNIHAKTRTPKILCAKPARKYPNERRG